MGKSKKAKPSKSRRTSGGKSTRRKAAATASGRARKKSAAPARRKRKRKKSSPVAVTRAAPSKKKSPPRAVARPSVNKPKSTPRAAPRQRVLAPALAGSPARERLGVVTAPSGRVVVFDVGLLGSLGRDEIAALQIALDGLPTDRELEVTGRRLGSGRYADCWADVTVELAPGRAVARSRELGRAPVDFARLMIIDESALDAWKHEEPMDGRADFVWWGRDAALLAQATGATAHADGYGWLDVPVAECIALGQHAEGLKARHEWLLRTDYRPHSHHYVALAQIRATPTDSGIVQVGGATACAFATTWGDGVFPVHVDLDEAGAPVALRIELATAEALANMDAVN